MEKIGKIIFKTISYTFQACFITTSLSALYTIGKLVRQNQEMSKLLKSTEEEEIQKLIDKGTNNYNDGYDDGYAEGYKDGYREAPREAYDDGYA